MKVGVLALQGDFEAHERALTRSGAEASQVRTAEELAAVDGLIIPGGESTTMLKLLRLENLVDPILHFAREKPIFGTCAGAILLARNVMSPSQESFKLIDIDVVRNAYGRHLDSRIVEIDGSFGGPGRMEAVFIRAPQIVQWSSEVTVLAEYQGSPVLAEQGRHMVATFHPELTADDRVHRRFLDKVRNNQ